MNISPQKPMLIIDWQSPITHRQFNLNILSLIEQECEFITYDSGMLSILKEKSNIKVHLLPDNEKRYHKTAQLVAEISKSETSKIFFISYDQVFLPMILYTFGEVEIFLYEHNTVPAWPKKYLKIFWQILFLRRCKRFCQNTAQEVYLKKLFQNAKKIGLPIGERILQSKKRNQILLPTLRGDDKNERLSWLAAKFSSYEIITKVDVELMLSSTPPNVTSVEKVDWESNSFSPMAIAIGLGNAVRPSGWFAEAVMRELWFIPLDDLTRDTFLDMFPDYPFLLLDEKISEKKMSDFCFKNFKRRHNHPIAQSLSHMKVKIEG